MGGRRKKAHSSGVVPIGGRAIKSRRIARIVTSSFHDITRSLKIAEEELAAANEVTRSDLARRVTELKSELTQMGGRHKYQEASIISTKHHQTSKWMIQSIKTLRPDYKDRGEHKLALLEVGAINNQLLRCPWLNVRAVDLNSQHPYIEEIDYFDVTPDPIYDFIVASMVVNCVPEPSRRAEMLSRVFLSCLCSVTHHILPISDPHPTIPHLYLRFCSHLKPRSLTEPLGGVLFLVLPLRFVAGCNCGKCIRKGKNNAKGNKDQTTSDGASGTTVTNVALEGFMFLLDVCGLVEVGPRRETPKLMFLTLGRRESAPRSDSDATSRSCSSDAKRKSSGVEWVTPSCMRPKTELLSLCQRFQEKYKVFPCCVCSLTRTQPNHNQSNAKSDTSRTATTSSSNDSALSSASATSSSSSTKLSAHCGGCGALTCSSLAFDDLNVFVSPDNKKKMQIQADTAKRVEKQKKKK